MQAGETDPAQWQYIATQGPLVSTIAEFWLMVVENDCRAVVMLTRVKEDTTSKCFQYYPSCEGEVFEVRRLDFAIALPHQTPLCNVQLFS